MQKIAMTLLLAFGLTGCTTKPYGNYAVASLEHNQKMAIATVSKLVTLYPPAHTRFKLHQPTTDAYGAALIQAMRNKSYALMEYTPQEQGSATNTAVATPGLDLHYIVDAPSSNSLYRVTILVGTQSISRAFTIAADGKLYPAGAWTRKE